MAIIKYRVEARTHDSDVRDAVIGSSWIYEEITSMEHAGKILTREEAHDRIKESKLILVFLHRLVQFMTLQMSRS